MKIPEQEATNGVDAGTIFANSISSPFCVLTRSTVVTFSSEKDFSRLVTTVKPFVIFLFFNWYKIFEINGEFLFSISEISQTYKSSGLTLLPAPNELIRGNLLL